MIFTLFYTLAFLPTIYHLMYLFGYELVYYIALNKICQNICSLYGRVSGTH